MSRYREVAIYWFIWQKDSASYRGLSLAPVQMNMNQRFRRRFKEIRERMGSRRKTAKLDTRSQILFDRIKTEWHAVQPRI